jgi:dTMP kinase
MGLEGVVPDHVFVLDVDPAVALARQGRPDRIGREGVDFQSSVRAAYLDLATQDDKVEVIEGSLSVDEIVTHMIRVIL